jgi:hypothetical protein
MGDRGVEVRWAEGTSPAERIVHDMLRLAVGPDVRLLPQVMLRVGERGTAQEVEADLVVVDPAHGVTVIEVKGGTMLFDPGRNLWRRREAAGQEVRDPVAQVKRALAIVKRHLDQSRFPVEAIPFRWVVATPDCTLDSPGEGLLPEELLWDARALGDMAGALARTQGRPDGGTTPIGEVRAEAIARALRGRAVEGTPSDAARVAAHEQQVVALTESHRNVMHQFLRHRRVLVRGAAGTGKTMLALEVAALHASQGARVLLTCWHKLLATHLREGLQNRLSTFGSPAVEDVTDDPTGRVVVTDLAALAGGAEPPTGADPREWFYEVLPDRLSPDATGGPFDVIVLDEAQDPGELWHLALAGLSVDDGRWFAFADRQQDLFGTAPALKDFVDVAHELRENFRNTRQIAAFATWFGDVETDCLTGNGPEVVKIAVPADRVVGRTTEIAKKLRRDEGYRPDQIAAIWLFHNPWKHDPGGLVAQHRGGEMVTTNSAAFKGMEREVVVLGIDVRPGLPLDDLKRLIYTAATRARSKLVVVADPDQLRQAELYILAGLFKFACPSTSG